MPYRRVLPVLAALALLAVEPAHSAWTSDPELGVPVTFLLAAREPALVPAGSAAAVDAAAVAWLAAFTEATGGRVALVPTGPARVLPVPAVGVLADAPATVARAAAAREGLLVIIAADLPLARPDCGCEAWALSARGREAAFGADAGFLGVVGLATLDELASDLRFRFLHEVAHAWCCYGDGSDGRGHWLSELEIGPDPLRGDGRERPHGAARYSPLTLSTMGVGAS